MNVGGTDHSEGLARLHGASLAVPAWSDHEYEGGPATRAGGNSISLASQRQKTGPRDWPTQLTWRDEADSVGRSAARRTSQSGFGWQRLVAPASWWRH